MTLVEALACAGSTTSNAGGVALVRRRSDGHPSKSPVTDVGPGVTEIRVDLTALQQGVLSNNPILRDGDTIAVPHVAPVYVFGKWAGRANTRLDTVQPCGRSSPSREGFPNGARQGDEDYPWRKGRSGNQGRARRSRHTR